MKLWFHSDMNFLN